MRLEPVEIVPDDAALPPRAAALLTRARAAIDAWFARPEHRAGIGFIPSDYEPVWRALVAVRRACPDARRLLEWGSGFGVVTGFGALLGMEAAGIEIDDDLVARAHELLRAEGLAATFVAGSFVPSDFDGGDLVDLETRTVLGEADGYDELGRDIDEFDVVFAYPWPTEEELYRELFWRYADYGAVLVTWSNQEGARVCRKVGGDGLG